MTSYACFTFQLRLRKTALPELGSSQTGTRKEPGSAMACSVTLRATGQTRKCHIYKYISGKRAQAHTSNDYDSNDYDYVKIGPKLGNKSKTNKIPGLGRGGLSISESESARNFMDKCVYEKISPKQFFFSRKNKFLISRMDLASGGS